MLRLPSFIYLIFYIIVFASLAGNGVAQPSASTLRKNQYLSILKTSTSTISERKEALDSLFVYCTQEGDTLQAYFYEMEKARIFSDFGNSFEAYAIYKSILQNLPFLDICSPKKDSLIRQVKLDVSIAAWQSAFWEESLTLTLDFLQQYPEPSLVELAQAYSNYGIINMNLGNMDESRANYRQALEIVEKNPDLFSIELKIRIANAMAGWFYMNEQYDSSLQILHQIEQSEEIHQISPIQFSYLYNNISLIHTTIGNYKISLDYLNKAFKFANSLSESNYVKSRILRNFGYLYRYKKQYELAEYYYLEALKYTQKLDDKENLWRWAIETGELYEEMGNIPLMQKYLLMGYKLKDQVLNTQNRQRILLLNKDFELLKISKQQKILEQALELEHLANQKKIILLTVLGSLLLIFLSMVIFMIFKLVRSGKKNQRLNETLLDTTESSKEQIRRKDQDLTAATLFAVQKDDTLKSLKQISTKLLSEISDEKAHAGLKEMLRLINTCYYGSSWDEFQLRFNMSYPNFYDNLQRSGITLTKSERYLAALLALNINAKEIASMTHKSVRSIETYIYRLRKKLEIAPEVKTTDFFHRFIGT